MGGRGPLHPLWVIDYLITGTDLWERGKKRPASVLYGQVTNDALGEMMPVMLPDTAAREGVKVTRCTDIKLTYTGR